MLEVGAEVASERDVGVGNRCLSTSLINGLGSQVGGDPFIDRGRKLPGRPIIASSLYIAGENTQQQGALQSAVISSYDDTDALNPGIQQLVDDNLESPEK